MVKISTTNGQSKLTVPVDIMELKKWDDNMEIIFVPLVSEPGKPLDKDTPILLKEIGIGHKSSGKSGKESGR